MKYSSKVYLILLVLGTFLLFSESKGMFPRSNLPSQDDDGCSDLICDINAVCKNETGSVSCICNEGWTGNGTVCTDIDECTEDVCDKNANCSNVEGSFTCTCNNGWRGNGTDCVDVNECSLALCDANAKCENEDGSFTCICNDGWSGDGFTCSVICANDVCDLNAECNNEADQPTCTCSEGWTGSGIVCADIDECSNEIEGSHDVCDMNAECSNEQGTFNCTCNEGWTGTGFECSDVDECSLDLCDDHATCQNSQGSYTCTCDEGWAGTGITCVDLDECYDQKSCDPNAQCMNGEGSFTCTCNEGWTGSGLVCEDINECSNEVCDVNAVCMNEPGSFACSCNEGWTGDGFDCTEIEVITCENDPCKDPQSFCVDVDQSYECPCKPGFYSAASSPTDCVQGLKFGSILFLASNTKATKISESEITRFLQRAYFTTNGFVSLNVAEALPNNTWDYELIYSKDSGTTEALIGSWFADYLLTEYSCDVESTSCTIDTFSGTSFELDAKSSVQNAGSADNVVCSSYEQYCNIESTRCDSVDGYAVCQCLTGYVQKTGAERSCTKQVCSENSDCNAPFGQCDTEFNEKEGRCICTFGFEGVHCYSPWLLVFIVVGGVLLLMTICTTYLACRFKQKTKVLPGGRNDGTSLEGLPKNGSATPKTRDNEAYVHTDF